MADGSLAVGGLASGLDTNSIITGLIQIENQRVVREEAKKSDYELKLSTFNELKTKLAELNTKATDMNKVTALNVFKSSTSDDTVANISGGDNATPGNFDIRIDSLASSLKVASRSYTKTVAQASLGLTGSFTLSTSAAALKADPTTTAVTVALDGSETLKDIASKINRATGAGATASVVQMGTDDYRLMLSAVDEGTTAFTLAPVSGDEALGIFSDGNGLDLVNPNTVGGTVNKQALHSTFDLRLAAGGPASATSTFAELFNGLGTGHGITAGDTITISGTRANGAAAAGTFTVGSTSDSLQTLLTSIGTAFGGTAAVSMNSSGEIVMTDTSGGTTAMGLTLTFNDSNVVVGETSTLSMGTAVAKTDFKSVISEGKKAFFQMNDIPFSSQTNRNETIIDGTIFELKKVSTSNVKLTLDYDKDGIKKKVQDFLDTYNQLIKYLDEKSKVEIKKKDDKDQVAGLTSGVRSTLIKGPFAGDSNILGLKSQLQGMFTNSINELTTSNLSKYSSLASMGITSEAKTGFLTINETTFKAAIDQDFEGIKRVFATNGYSDNPAHSFGTSTKDTQTGIYNVDPSLATPLIDTLKDGATQSYVTPTISGDALNRILTSPSGDSNGLTLKAAATSGTGKMTFVRGVAGQVKNFYDKINNYVDGFITTTGKNFQDRINAQDVQIAKLEKRVASVKTRLTATFSNLELSISKLQAQSAAFGNQISSLKR
jgi:flagellar hook-associated protein 2